MEWGSREWGLFLGGTVQQFVCGGENVEDFTSIFFPLNILDLYAWIFLKKILMKFNNVT